MYGTVTRRLLALIVVAISFPAWSQQWPTKPIRIFVPQGAGSGQDAYMRYLAEHLTKALGQQIIIENRPGGGGTIGTRAAATAPADGYNFVVASSASFASTPHTVKVLGYDPLKDFIPVAMISAPGGFLMVANSKLPVKTFADLVAIGKADPGKLSIVVDGPRNATGLMTAYINKVTGANLTLVPYTNTMQGLQDTVSGTTGLFIQGVGLSLPFIKDGALRPIAVTGAVREELLPDTPTLAELYPNVDVKLFGWLLIAAPTGTPPEAVERMNRELDRIFKEPQVVEWLRNYGAPRSFSAGTPAQLRDFVRSEYGVWEKVVKTIGLEPE